MQKCTDQCARCPYYFALYGTMGILIWKLLFASYRLSNYNQSKQSHDNLVYISKSFKSNHFSVISNCTKLCVSSGLRNKVIILLRQILSIFNMNKDK